MELIDRDLVSAVISYEYDFVRDGQTDIKTISEFHDSVQDIISKQPTVNTWISVEDRLPSEEGKYLCCVANSETNKFVSYDILPYFQEMSGRHVWAIDQIYKNQFKVIAWMPIPEYSKESE